MSVPKQRHTKQRRDRKRERFAIEPVKMQTCTQCGKETLPHRACTHCGFYKGKEIVNTLKNTKLKSQK